MSRAVPLVAPDGAAPRPQPLQGEGEIGVPNKYLYEEFAGYEGERRLKAILRKILPLALYRTWEVLVERQAPGNDCFLSIPSIAETAERAERTIRLNIHEFKARHLLVLRPACKLLRQADGSSKHKLVVVKDFAGLYALAHEYLCWTESDGYIEPERDFAEVIRSDETLTCKVMRFNNYRRLMENTVPGPKPQEREVHLWYTQYTPESESQEQEQGTVSGSTGLLKEERRAESAEDSRRSPMWKQYLLEKLPKELSKDSEERITQNDHQKHLKRDSFDSATSLEERGGGYTKPPNEHIYGEQVRTDSYSEPTKTNQTNPSPPSSRAAGAKQASGKERADLDERALAFVQQAISADNTTQETPHGQHAAPNVAPNPLVSAFVREVSSLFCDQNVKASLTRALRAVEQTSLSQKDILACLVKAYLVTQATKQVREQYRRPDGDIKMPLFCTLFARFITQCAVGTFGSTDEHLARDIASDDRLVLFIVEHQLEATVLAETVAVPTTVAVAGNEGNGQPDVLPVGTDAETTPSVAAQRGADDDEMQAEAAQVEPPQPSPPLQLEAESPELGWNTPKSADWWARRLRDALGDEHYNYTVSPTQYGRYGFVFFVRCTPSDAWVFLTSDEVSQYL